MYFLFVFKSILTLQHHDIFGNVMEICVIIHAHTHVNCEGCNMKTMAALFLNNVNLMHTYIYI